MLKSVLSIAVAITALASFDASEGRAETVLDAQLKAILAVLPGVYAGERPIAAPPKGEMVTIFHAFTPITAPQFGEVVVYYELRRGTADAPASQRKIFSFDLDPARTVNSMKAFVLGPDQAPGNLAEAPGLLASLAPDALMTFPAQCDLIWSASGTAFKAEVRPEDCGYTSVTFKKTIRPAMTYLVDGDDFQWAETLNTGDMQVIFTTGGLLPAVRQ